MIIIVFPVAPAGNSGIYHLLFYGNGNILVIIQLVPQVLAAAIVPKRIILVIMIVATVISSGSVCRVCIATYRLFHRAGLVDNKNNISGDIRFLLRNDLRAGGESLQRDGVGAIFVGCRRLADLHATVGLIVRIGSCAGHVQRAEKRQAQKQR